MSAQAQEWLMRPEFWLIVAVVLYVLETLLDTFYLGGAAVGAVVAAAGVGLIPLMGQGSGLLAGTPIAIWGGGTLISCTLTRFFNRRSSAPPDVNERNYSGDDP